jgi:phosphohistidine phosphatase
MTQRRLLLVRHAKTEQGAPDPPRRLTDRGRRDAAEIGRWIAAQDLVPDLVVVSPAARARQTWELAGPQLPTAPPVTVDERIYDNTVEDLVAVVRQTQDSVQTVALVGHNPSIEALTSLWVGGGSAAKTREDFPTGSVAVFSIDGSWADADAGTVSLTDFATCRG